MEVRTQRIDYFDLMKGVCIILVVLHHCGLLHTAFLRCIRIPLYFMLSGMFFKKYSGIFEFTIRKINRLMIPWAAWMLLCYAIFHHINTPLWFLSSLFCSYLLYYCIDTLIIEKKNNRYLNIIFFVVLSFISYELSFVHVDNNVVNIILRYFVISLATMPFFFFSSELRKNGVLSKDYSNKSLIMVGILGAIVCYFTSVSGISYRLANFEGYPLYYFSAIGGVCAIWALCYKIKRMPYFSYMGRYSIIVLVTHYPVILTMRALHIDKWLIAVVILIVSPILIYLLKRYAPHITAQKDIIHYNPETRKVSVRLRSKFF